MKMTAVRKLDDDQLWNLQRRIWSITGLGQPPRLSEEKDQKVVELLYRSTDPDVAISNVLQQIERHVFVELEAEVLRVDDRR